MGFSGRLKNDRFSLLGVEMADNKRYIVMGCSNTPEGRCRKPHPRHLLCGAGKEAQAGPEDQVARYIFRYCTGYSIF